MKIIKRILGVLIIAFALIVGGIVFHNQGGVSQLFTQDNFITIFAAVVLISIGYKLVNE